MTQPGGPGQTLYGFWLPKQVQHVIPYTAKLSRGKTFADAQNHGNSRENICGCILNLVQEKVAQNIFVGKTSRLIAKTTNVFPLDSFAVYGNMLQ